MLGYHGSQTTDVKGKARRSGLIQDDLLRAFAWVRKGHHLLLRDVGAITSLNANIVDS